MGTYVTAAGGTANEVMIREDLQNWMSMLEPTDAPLHSLLPVHPMASRSIEYGVDRFGIDRASSSIFSNARNEADTGLDPTAIYPTRLRSIAGIYSEVYSVSGTDRASTHAAISDPLDYRAYKALVRVTQMHEKAMLFSTGGDATATVAPTGPNATKRVTQGLIPWCATTGIERFRAGTGSRADETGNLIPSEYWSWFHDNGGLGLSRDVMLNKILGPAVNNGFRAQDSIGMCGAKVKQSVTEFFLSPNGAYNQRTIPAADKLFIDVVDVIETTFGRIYINWNRWFDQAQSTTIDATTNTSATSAIYPVGATASSANLVIPWDETIIFMMPGYVKRGVFRGATAEPLGKTKDASEGLIVAEEGLIVTNPLALCGATNLLP